MPNHAAVTDHSGKSGSGMYDCAVLHRCASTDGDRPVVATKHCARPHGGLWSKGDIADDHCIRVDIRLRVDGGNEVPESVDGHGLTLRHGATGEAYSSLRPDLSHRNGRHRVGPGIRRPTPAEPKQS